MLKSLYFIRHGETAWSLSGQHTSRTDLPLTEQGERAARGLADKLRGVSFTHVFTSPRLRAQRTCELAGLGALATIAPDLAEWEYGDYEGLRSSEIAVRRPGWNIYRDGCPNGEMPAAISARVDRLLSRLWALEGDVVVFSHGHLGRVLVARWIGLSVTEAQRFSIDPASISILGFDQTAPAVSRILQWNVTG